MAESWRQSQRGLTFAISVKWRSHDTIELTWKNAGLLKKKPKKTPGGQITGQTRFSWHTVGWLFWSFFSVYLSNEVENPGLHHMSAPHLAASCPWARHLSSEYSVDKGRSLQLDWAGVNVCRWMNLDVCVMVKTLMPSEFTLFLELKG